MLTDPELVYCPAPGAATTGKCRPPPTTLQRRRRATVSRRQCIQYQVGLHQDHPRLLRWLRRVLALEEAVVYQRVVAGCAWRPQVGGDVHHPGPHVLAVTPPCRGGRCTPSCVLHPGGRFSVPLVPWQGRGGRCAVFSSSVIYAAGNRPRAPHAVAAAAAAAPDSAASFFMRLGAPTVAAVDPGAMLVGDAAIQHLSDLGTRAKGSSSSRPCFCVLQMNSVWLHSSHCVPSTPPQVYIHILKNPTPASQPACNTSRWSHDPGPTHHLETHAHACIACTALS